MTLAFLFSVNNSAVRAAELDFGSAASTKDDAAAALAGNDVQESPELLPAAMLDTSLEKKGRTTVHHHHRVRVQVRRWPFDPDAQYPGHRAKRSQD